jgi:hypothetical protein
MSVVTRTTVVALVFTGSVAAAAYAANNDQFYSSVTNSVSNLAGNFVTAGAMVSGDFHLDDPSFESYGDKRFNERIASSSVVTHVEVIGGSGKQRIVLLNPDGEEVYSHDPEHNTTIVAKDVVIPSITYRDGPNEMAELRVVTAAPAIKAPAELREALVAGVTDQPDLFYKEDL